MWGLLARIITFLAPNSFFSQLRGDQVILVAAGYRNKAVAVFGAGFVKDFDFRAVAVDDFGVQVVGELHAFHAVFFNQAYVVPAFHQAVGQIQPQLSAADDNSPFCHIFFPFLIADAGHNQLIAPLHRDTGMVGHQLHAAVCPDYRDDGAAIANFQMADIHTDPLFFCFNGHHGQGGTAEDRFTAGPGFDKGNPHGVGGEVGGADGFQAEPGENLLAGWDREMRGEHVG